VRITFKVVRAEIEAEVEGLDGILLNPWSPKAPQEAGNRERFHPPTLREVNRFLAFGPLVYRGLTITWSGFEEIPNSIDYRSVFRAVRSGESSDVTVEFGVDGTDGMFNRRDWFEVLQAQRCEELGELLAKIDSLPRNQQT
jgi:hypothetical protein